MEFEMVAEIALPAQSQEHLRRLDVRRDLARVADLVELCFSDTLDLEGRQYLAEMRRAAQAASMMRLAGSLMEDSAYLPSGYVWEEAGQLVGNLSLIPINLGGKRGYMIANVATHPEYRGRGIATALTMTALRYAREHGASGVWLQVRDDNPPAIHIYEMNGFIERLRRTTWYSGPTYQVPPTPAGVKVTHRQSRHWPLQRAWLTRLYPDDLTWNMPFDWNLFRPDLWGSLYRAFSLEFIRHWSVERCGELKGILSWKHSPRFADTLWLAMPEQLDTEAIGTLVAYARSMIRREQPLSLNYPAGTAVEVLRQAGFYPQQTLIWMSTNLTP
jgi:ribosomal protein S18 acetylase RimI-like enzyme